jgi:beta-mannosidase
MKQVKFIAIIGLLGIFSLQACQNLANSHKYSSKITRESGGEMPNERVQLNLEWQFRNSKDSITYPAQVPGNIHTDLFKNKLIDNPYYADNEFKLQWIEKEDWIYESEFEITESQYQKSHLNLEFEGLDTYANIYINDNLVSKTENMFLAYVFDIKSFVKPGYNKIKVHFLSPINQAMPIYEAAGIKYPADNDRSEEHLSVFTRKAPYHYGWDWGPRYVTSGIYRPINLHLWDDAKIDDLHITHEINHNNSAELKLHLSIYSDIDQKVELSANIAGKLWTKEVQLIHGDNKKELDLTIENAKLWWPQGMGEQHLYTVDFKLIKAGKTIDNKQLKYGIRDIEVVNKEDSLGQSFYFKVNNKNIYIKGANYIPNDMFLGKMTDSVYQNVFKNTRKSNINMLRVWGGGVYEDDRFYELADENGILIWQDFMFACTMYPGDDDFLANVEKEAIYNIKRLRNHSSLALWCGNNEVQVGWDNWGWQNSYKYDEQTQQKLINDYNKLFKNLLPNLVKEYDDKFYFHSSPISNWGDLKDMKIADNHYWGVWWGKHPFEKFNDYVPRFMSEFGFQSFPNIKTIEAFAEKKDLQVRSDVMNSHQKSSIGNETIEQYMDMYYKKPTDFEDFVYINQIMQAMGMDIGFRAHRRSKPFNMGTLYWQLNDVWPAISWSGIDYFGRWKAMQYKIAKAFEDVISSTIIEDEKIKIYLISDLPKTSTIKSEVKLMKLSGEILFQKSFANKISSGKNIEIFNKKIEDLIGDNKKENLLILVENYFDNKTTQEIKYLCKPRELTLKKADLIIETSQKDGRIILNIKSNYLVKDLELSTDVKGNFSDNYFDVLPGINYQITFDSQSSLEEFNKTFKYKSLIDTYKK